MDNKVFDGPSQLRMEESVQLTATVWPEDTNDKSVVWLTNNNNIAQVSSDGIVTGISVGETVIRARSKADYL